MGVVVFCMAINKSLFNFAIKLLSCSQGRAKNIRGPEPPDIPEQNKQRASPNYTALLTVPITTLHILFALKVYFLSPTSVFVCAGKNTVDK